MHLRMRSSDYLFNFSSELLVVALLLVVTGFNIGYFGFLGIHPSGKQRVADQSLANKLLSYHVALNNQLYAHNNAEPTTVVSGGSPFVQVAYADQSTLPDEETAPVDPDDFIINDGAMVRPNNADAKQLIKREVRIYETQTGDTLSQIAQKYNITSDTVKWANQLKSDTIKQGWFLLIPQIDGVLVKADDNTTLADIVAAFPGANAETIISYNALSGPLDVNAGDIIMVPGATVKPPPAPKAKSTGISYQNGRIVVASGTNHQFPYGQCTYYVAKRLIAEGVSVTWGGNASAWNTTAAAKGAKVNRNNPQVGGIIQLKMSRYGHVGFITAINGNTITYQDMNGSAGFGKVGTNTISIDSSVIKSFINVR